MHLADGRVQYINGAIHSLGISIDTYVEDEEHIMWSHKDRRMSVYSEVNIDAQVEPLEGKCRMKRDGTPRCLGRGDG